eukprot:CAMPEP_0178428686 /NCGR_PEP_ID=MMETSP0689_2-20121128/30407_1 /TAXON_ID=160604 /ORGANISM="Amphidinium massartii, Strain CS-259" /LENGTH=379 /DNA_ID=CAMNT_0020050469 /DNA_START=65 /DNA_END=1205 /DNA_ORIENTATION=+
MGASSMPYGLQRSGELESLARALAGGERAGPEEVSALEAVVAEWLMTEGYDAELARRLAGGGSSSIAHSIPEDAEAHDDGEFRQIPGARLTHPAEVLGSGGSSSSRSTAFHQAGLSTSSSASSVMWPTLSNNSPRNSPLLLPELPYAHRRSMLQSCPICMESRESFEIAGCGHRVCVRCAVTYIRVALGNAAEEVHASGVYCPLNGIEKCGALITPDAVRVLLRASILAAPQTSSFAGPLSEMEVDRFDRFVVEASLPFGEKVHCPRCERVSLLTGARAAEEGECPYCAYRWNHKERFGKDSATAQVKKGRASLVRIVAFRSHIIMVMDVTILPRAVLVAVHVATSTSATFACGSTVPQECAVSTASVCIQHHIVDQTA